MNKKKDAFKNAAMKCQTHALRAAASVFLGFAVFTVSQMCLWASYDPEIPDSLKKYK